MYCSRYLGMATYSDSLWSDRKAGTSSFQRLTIYQTQRTGNHSEGTLGTLELTKPKEHLGKRKPENQH